MNFYRCIALCLFICVVGAFGLPSGGKDSIPLADLECNLSQERFDEIHGYQDVVDDIIELFINGNFKGKTYDLLAELTDTYGPRMTGSQSLDDAIDWIVANATLEGFTAYTEDVMALHWVRNNESLRMISPREANINVLGLGGSVGTPPEGIEAEVLVVSSFDDLSANADKAPGKIVVYDVPFESYGDAVQYRFYGAREASKVGGVASIIRSVEDFSMVTPHTGISYYDDDVPKIPAAAIGIEDSALLHRLQERGETIILQLFMGAETLPDFQTRNTIIDTIGSTNPDEIVVVSGHLDSWDVGVGAMDDGGGVTISWMANRALRELGITPRRTYRTIMFTAEEQGIYGGDAYFQAHGKDKQNFQLMMESDMGTFTPYGIGFTGTDEATCIMNEIVSLTSLLGTTTLNTPADQSDLGGFETAGVPIGSLFNDISRYFWFHHSNADRLEVYTSEGLDVVGALWTAVSYVSADVSFRFPQRIVQEGKKFK